jgi:hypothetical protein
MEIIILQLNCGTFGTRTTNSLTCDFCYFSLGIFPLNQACFYTMRDALFRKNIHSILARYQESTPTFGVVHIEMYILDFLSSPTKTKLIKL